AIDSDAVGARVDERREAVDTLAVYRDAPLIDHPLAGPSGSDAGRGEHTLQPHAGPGLRVAGAAVGSRMTAGSGHAGGYSGRCGVLFGLERPYGSIMGEPRTPCHAPARLSSQTPP